MAVSITATQEADENFPSIQLDLAGLGSVDFVTVTRVSDTGAYPTTPVRGLDEAPVLGATMQIFDYEAPFNDTYTYHLDAWIGSPDASPDDTNDSVSITQPLPVAYTGNINWLRHVHTPQLSRACVIEDLQYTRATRQLSKTNVLGRKFPVIITDVTAGRQGDATVVIASGIPGMSTFTLDQMNLIIDDGDVLMFQTTSDEFKDMYLVVDGEVDFERISTMGSGDAVYRAKFAFTEVAQPPTNTGAVYDVIWNDVEAAFADWDAVETAMTNWAEVLQGNF